MRQKSPEPYVAKDIGPVFFVTYFGKAVNNNEPTTPQPGPNIALIGYDAVIMLWEKLHNSLALAAQRRDGGSTTPPDTPASNLLQALPDTGTITLDRSICLYDGRVL